MPSAYVLFNTESGSEEQVLNEIKKIEDIAEASISYGVYDIIVKVKTETDKELKELVTFKLRRIHNVRSTLTLRIIE
ncbi:MAG: Lrp/AsnC ligand binding domain-containing protein [Candidatus Bathyarchaeota archaeon]|nr:Lrp/AsnC ligand binding domain-containing protein [Candidatus Bathyarchaeota archaeon]MDD4326438.1 Lrp/AsnC ligand binding domain-containing protein [Candidatus Bathyarchaeota archaeon]NLD65454.1 Lrp/AsnC family transcriptional regulator [Thermoproteota archaeon]